MSIQMTIRGFAEDIRPAHVPSARRSSRTATLDKKEISVLRPTMEALIG